MTRDEIIALARLVRDGGHWNQLDIIRFAALVAAHEREACAKVCDEFAERDRLSNYYAVAARAIRARGENK